MPFEQALGRCCHHHLRHLRRQHPPRQHQHRHRHRHHRHHHQQEVEVTTYGCVHAICLEGRGLPQQQ